MHLAVIFSVSALISLYPQNICMKPTCMTKGTTKIKYKVSMETSWSLTTLTLNACIDITAWVIGLALYRPSLFKHYVAVGTGILLHTDCSSILLDARMAKSMSGSLTKTINLGCKTLEKITLPQITCTYYAYQMVSHQFALRHSWLFSLDRIMTVKLYGSL